MFAGIGNDPRENRKFNMIKQAGDYDGEGDFVRLWLPELAGVPGGKVQSPWLLTTSQLATAGVELGLTYPKPILLPPEWSRHAAKNKTKAGPGETQNTGGQKGINFYFKPEVSGGAPQAVRNKKHLRGGRVQ